MCACVCVCVCVRVHVCVCVCVCVCMRMRMCVYSRIHVQYLRINYIWGHVIADLNAIYCTVVGQVSMVMGYKTEHILECTYVHRYMYVHTYVRTYVQYVQYAVTLIYR